MIKVFVESTTEVTRNRLDRIFSFVATRLGVEVEQLCLHALMGDSLTKYKDIHTCSRGDIGQMDYCLFLSPDCKLIGDAKLYSIPNSICVYIGYKISYAEV